MLNTESNYSLLGYVESIINSKRWLATPSVTCLMTTYMVVFSAMQKGIISTEEFARTSIQIIDGLRRDETMSQVIAEYERNNR